MSGVESGSFGFLDYVILVATCILSLTIGLYKGLINGRQRTRAEYLLGEEELGIFPVSISLAMSFFSPISILAFSSEIYSHGSTVWFFLLGAALGMLYAVMYILPVFGPLHITSINEYLRDRFDSTILVAFGWLSQFVIALLTTSTSLIVLAVMIDSMAGIPVWLTALLVGATATVYTTLGGLKAVVYTDVFHAAVILIGLFTIIIRGLYLIGGVARMLAWYNEGDRSSVDVHPSPFVHQTVWGALTMGVVFSTSSFTAMQAAVQRYKALPNLTAARRSSVRASFLLLLLIALCLFCGMVACAHYTKLGCDPLAAGYVQHPSQIMAYFAMSAMDFIGAAGLFCACLLAASLSNISSALNCIAALTWTDLLSWKLDHISENKKSSILHVITAVAGAMAILFGYIMTESIIEIILVIGAFAASILLTMTVGTLLPRINSKSMLMGTLITVAVALFLSLGRMYVYIYQQNVPTGDTSNCIRLRLIINNNTATDTPTVVNGHNLATHTNSQLTVIPDEVAARNTSSEQFSRSSVMLLFQISPNWVLPISIVLGLIVSLLASLLPGCQTRSQGLNPKCYIHCIRERTINNYGYKKKYKIVQTVELGDFYLSDH